MIRNPARIACWLAFAAASVAGLWARFHALGIRQLAVDEYYFVRSVEFILDSGWPAIPGGGYYVRGPLAQYATAAAALSFGDGGFAWRLTPVLCSLAAVWLAWAYGRRHAGPLAAAAVAGVMLLSSWQVEFARFARMYAPFQCATLLFLVVAERAFVDRRRGWLYAPHLACVVATLTHEMGVLLAPLLLLPLADRDSPARTSRLRATTFAAAGAATALFCAAATRLDLRSVGVSERYPPGFVRAGRESMLRLPELPFSGLDGRVYLALLAAVLAALGLALLPRLRRDARSGGAELLAALAAAAAAFHALMVTAICAALLVLRYGIRGMGRRARGIALLALGLSAAWLVWTWRDAAALGVGAPGGPSLAGAAVAVLFGWPEFWPALVRPWLGELPVVTLAAAAAAACVVFTRREEPWSWLVRSPLLPLAWVATCIALLESFYLSTRYTHFVYPVVWVLIAQGALEALRGLRARTGRALPAEAGAALLVAAVFLGSGDFSPRHLAGVAGPEASFRIGRFAGRDRTWYPRADFRSPAEFLDGRAGPRDGIVVAGLPPVSYYLAHDHAVYIPRAELRFAHVSRQRGTVELWSSRRLLGTAEELRDFAARHETLWLVRRADRAAADAALDSLLSAGGVRSERASVGLDGRVEVVRVEGLGAGAAAAGAPSGPRPPQSVDSPGDGEDEP